MTWLEPGTGELGCYECGDGRLGTRGQYGAWIRRSRGEEMSCYSGSVEGKRNSLPRLLLSSRQAGGSLSLQVWMFDLQMSH